MPFSHDFISFMVHFFSELVIFISVLMYNRVLDSLGWEIWDSEWQVI